MFQSKLISRGAKLKLYWSVVRPAVTYSCETWVLQESEINKLLVFERKILRKIFGPCKGNDSWWMKTNQELNQLINHKNIINIIRAQRLSWQPLGARPVSRLKTCREDDVEADIKIVTRLEDNSPGQDKVERCGWEDQNSTRVVVSKKMQTKTNSVALARKWTVPTKRPLPVEVLPRNML
jgi:hypothetical protein